MSVQYKCRNEKRRQILRDSTGLNLNGIDYLEVLDSESPAGTIPQCTLLVRMVKEAPKNLTADDVEISGGVRVTPIEVEWVIRASEASDSLVASGQITQAEKDFFLSLTEPSLVLVVRTKIAGDFSQYTLSILQPGTLDPVQEFDPILSQVDFFFKVECPSEFDCKTEITCPTPSEPEPHIDYLSKDYTSFRQLMLDRLAIIMPDWQERNTADVGIALVEVMAYAGDYLSYYQDAVGTEAYLGTARKRVSMRRYARLLDYNMHDGCNARTWVHFDVSSDGVWIDKGTRLLTQIEMQPVRIKPENYEALLAQKPAVFETMHNYTLFTAHNRIEFYTWGETDCCLPKGSTRATLTGKLDNMKEGDVLVFVEERNPDTHSLADADITHRHAVRLSNIQFSIDPLFNNEAVTEISWMNADALPFPLCVSLVQVPAEEGGSPGALQPVSAALGNIVLCDHGRTVETLIGEYMVPERSGNHSFCRFNAVEITHSVAYSFEQDKTRQAAGNVYGSLAASELLAQDARKALPSVILDDGSQLWQPQQDLLSSDRFAAEFVVEIEDTVPASIRFGDGLNGRIPDQDAEFTATYRTGNGSSGNIGADGLHHIITTDSAITAVWNPMSAEGGTDSESLEEVRQYAPQAFRVQERAVTEADYAEVAQRHPGVQKAVARRRWTGSWYTMFLSIDRYGGLEVDDKFEADIVDFLDKYRLAGQDLEIEKPIYVPLDISATVCVESGYFLSDVKQALLEAFDTRDNPDRTRGFFHPDNFTFGQPVYLSQFIARAMQVPGVRWVNMEQIDPQTGKPNGNHFKRWGQPPHGELERGWVDIGGLEIARLDNDPNAPENGKLEFTMEGGV